MRRTIKLPVDLPRTKFLKLMELCSEIFNAHTEWAFNNKTDNRSRAHKELYRDLVEKYNEVPTGLIQSVRDTAFEAIRATKFKFKPSKSKTSAIRYDCRCAAIRGNLLSLSCIGKRERIMLKIPEYFQEVFSTWKFTGMQLCYRNNKFFVHLNFNKESPSILKDGDILGIDRGINNVVYCSNGFAVSGKPITKVKRRISYRRRKLQEKGTRSARRALRKMSGREKRFILNENHRIAKTVVSLPYTTFVLEKLRRMNKKNKGRQLNRRISGWSYFQLEQFLEYKAEAIGKSVCFVDARYTSQKCSACGCVAKSNRNREKFVCKSCGHTEHADFNAAKNIRDLHIMQISDPKGQVGVNQPKADKLIQEYSFLNESASSGASPLSS
jgi:putative transposase